MRSKWIANISLRQRYAVVAELALIAIWALFISRNYLNMDPRIVPPEMSLVQQSNPTIFGHKFRNADGAHYGMASSKAGIRPWQMYKGACYIQLLC